MDYPAELDPVGADVQIFNPYIEFPPEPGSSSSLYPSYGTPGYQSTSYAIDGMPVTADRFLEEVSTWFGSGLGYATLQSNVIRSRQIVGWRRLYWEFIDTENLPNPEDIIGVLLTPGHGPLYYAPIFNNSWAFSSTIIPQHIPQNPAPITVRYMSQKYVKDFLKGLQEAEKRLQKADCAKLFGKLAADLVTMLENTEYQVLAFKNGAPKYDSATGETTVTGAQTNSPTSVFINEKGPFFNNRMFVIGKSGLQTLDANSGLHGKEFSALLLLHELGHQTGIFGSDAGNQKLNDQYTQQVRKACF